MKNRWRAEEDRGTVAVHVRPAKPTISTTGSDDVDSAKPAISTLGSTAGRVSFCRRFLPAITTAMTAGLSAKRIHQDLVRDHDFEGMGKEI